MFFARQSRIRKQGQTGNTLTGNACRDVCACHAVTSFLDNLAQVLHISDSSIRLVLEDDQSVRLHGKARCDSRGISLMFPSCTYIHHSYSLTITQLEAFPLLCSAWKDSLTELLSYQDTSTFCFIKIRFIKWQISKFEENITRTTAFCTQNHERKSRLQRSNSLFYLFEYATLRTSPRLRR